MTFYQALHEHLKQLFPDINLNGTSFSDVKPEEDISAILRPLPTGRFDYSDLRMTQNFQLQIRVQDGASSKAALELDKLMRFFNPQFQQEQPIELGVHQIHYRSSGAAVPLGDRDPDGSYLWEIIVTLNYSNNAVTSQI